MKTKGRILRRRVLAEKNCIIASSSSQTGAEKAKERECGEADNEQNQNWVSRAKQRASHKEGVGSVQMMIISRFGISAPTSRKRIDGLRLPTWFPHSHTSAPKSETNIEDALFQQDEAEPRARILNHLSTSSVLGYPEFNNYHHGTKCLGIGCLPVNLTVL